MSGLVASVRAAVAPGAIATSCESPNCVLSLDDAPSCRIIVDFDRPELGLVGQMRADFLFVGETDADAWVAPIEMKGTQWNWERVAGQLQAGADAADGWLPAGSSFLFCPVLAHRAKPFSIRRRRWLRAWQVTLRGRVRPLVAIECGRPLTEALAQAE